MQNGYAKKGLTERKENERKSHFLRVLLISKVKTPYVIYAWRVFSLASEQHPYTLFSWGYPFLPFSGWLVGAANASSEKPDKKTNPPLPYVEED